MSQIPQQPNAAEKDPAQRLTYLQGEFNGCYTASPRVGVPKDKLYNLENLIPVGPQNAQIVPNIGPQITSFGGDTIYWAQSLGVAGTPSFNTNEYIFAFSTQGNMYAVFLGSNTVNQGWVPHTGPNPATAILSGLSGTRSRMAQWSRTVGLIIDQTGYYTYGFAALPPQLVTGPGVPTTGDDIAVFAGRVWIASGQTILVSGPGEFSAAAWLPANGAFFFTLTDPPLRSTIQRMMSANGLLYIYSTTGVNVISNVQVVSGSDPPITNLQNTNIQAVIGTDQPASVVPYDRFLAFANRYGCYVMYGISAPKISDDINGTWQNLDFSQAISAGQVSVAGILCLAFLIKRLNDPIFGSNTVLALWFKRNDEDIWWFANYGAMNFMVTAYNTNTPTLYGFLNGGLYQLFADPTTFPSTQVMTGLYSMEDPTQKKEALTFGFEANLLNNGPKPTATIDTDDPDFPSRPINFPQTVAQGVKLFSAGGANLPSTFNRHIGFTLNTSGLGIQYRFLACDYKLRERWFQFIT